MADLVETATLIGYDCDGDPVWELSNGYHCGGLDTADAVLRWYNVTRPLFIPPGSAHDGLVTRADYEAAYGPITEKPHG